MKTSRWLALIAAVLITLFEMLAFTGGSIGAPQKQTTVAAATLATGRHS